MKLHDLWRVLRGDLSSAALRQAQADALEACRIGQGAIADAAALRHAYDSLYREFRETSAQIFRVSQCIDAESMRREMSKLVADNETRMQAESKIIGDVAKKMLKDRGVVI